MSYVSARYMPEDPLTLPGSPRPVQAVDEQGQVWSLREDSEVGDWLRYLEEGGTIDPVDAQPETKPAPDPAPLPVPEPVDPNAPRAQPDVLQDAPLPEE